MKWIKPHEGGKFPTVEKKYLLRSAENTGFCLFITPHCIDRDLWLREKREWLDETPPPPKPDVKEFLATVYDQYEEQRLSPNLFKYCIALEKYIKEHITT